MRSRRDTDTFFKRFTAEGFYHVMNALGADIVFNHADYRLISTRVLESFADYREVNIFLRGMVPLVGFKSEVVTYERHERLNLGGKFSSYGVSNNNMYSGSIGVRGTHGEKSRFVTASHCIPKLTISGVVSDKEQKTISFCASKSDIQDAAELNLNIIDYIKMNDKVKEIRRASIIMSQYITLDKVNRKYSVDISETKALELGVNKMNYDRVVLEIENVNNLLVDNPDVDLIDLKLQYKEYKEKLDSVFNR